MHDCECGIGPGSQKVTKGTKFQGKVAIAAERAKGIGNVLFWLPLVSVGYIWLPKSLKEWAAGEPVIFLFWFELL
jgi:hypothetical protein